MTMQLNGDSIQNAPRSGVLTPVRLRKLLERLGPTFIKLGQFLALRPDLISQEYCNELLKLTDQVETFSFEIARRIIAEDLGDDLEKMFSYINPKPLAAGSLAQAHRARTLGGAEVVIKVQRENIAQAVETDLKRARKFVRILHAVRFQSVVSPEEVLEELTRWMKDELDMTLELRNLTRMYDLVVDNRILQVPKPYPKLSGQRVLTLEYLPGIPVSELLKMINVGYLEEIDDLGFDRAKLARNILYTVLEQIFSFKFFHADTHPGNIIAMLDNSVGFVDFGLAETLDDNFRATMIRLLSAVYANDFESMFQALVEMLVPGKRSDLAQFRADFFEQSRRWQRERESDLKGVPRRESPISRYLVGVLRAARRNDFQVPTGILSMYRSLLTAETVANQLGGNTDLAAVGRQIFERIQIEFFFESFRPDNWRTTMADVLSLLKDGPRQTQQMLRDILEGQLVFRVNSMDSDEDQRLKNLRARLISSSVLTVSLVLLLVNVQNISSAGQVPLTYLLWGCLILLWGWIAITWRRLR